MLPDPVRDLLSQFYGLTIEQTQHSMNNPNIRTSHSAADYFIEISAPSISVDPSFLDNAADYIRHCIENSFIHRLNRYNVPHSVLNHIAFETGYFLSKLANHKYYVVPNKEDGDSSNESSNAMSKLDAITDYIHCKRIEIGSLSAKDIDIIFNAFQSTIDRWKWEYSFSIWIDRVDREHNEVLIGYFDVTQSLRQSEGQSLLSKSSEDAVQSSNTQKSREFDLIQLHDEITHFFSDNLFEVVGVSNVEGLESKWKQFWDEIKGESELVTMTMYDDKFVIFKTKREFGASAVMKCKQWLQDQSGNVALKEEELEVEYREFGDRDGIEDEELFERLDGDGNEDDDENEDELEQMSFIPDDGFVDEDLFRDLRSDHVMDDSELLDEEEEDAIPDPHENLFQESRASKFLQEILENQDQKVAEEIAAEHDDVRNEEVSELEYDLQLFKECTSPLLTEDEFIALNRDIGRMHVKRLRGVGQVMEKTLKAYSIETVSDLSQRIDESAILSIPGMKKVSQHVFKLVNR